MWVSFSTAIDTSTSFLATCVVQTEGTARSFEILSRMVMAKKKRAQGGPRW